MDRGKTVGRNAAVGGSVDRRRRLHASGAALGFWLESENQASEGLGWRPVEGDVMEIALTENPAGRASPTPSSGESERAAVSSVAARFERHSPTIAITDSEQRAAAGAPTASQAQDSAERYALDPSAPRASEPNVDLGIEPGSWAKWGSLTVPPPTAGPVDGRAPAPASSTGGLAEALEVSDREMGLGPSGAVLSAARDAAAWVGAPRSGVAQFAITLYQGGEVDIALADTDGNASAWTEVGERIAKALRLRRPRLKTGVRMVVELVTKERWADGSSTKADGPRPSVTLPVPRSTDDAKTDLQRRNLAAAPPPGAPAEQRPMALIPDAPGAFVSGRGRIGKVAMGVGAFPEVGHGDAPKVISGGLVLKGDIDVTNLAGKATRTISTRVLSARAL